MKKLKFLSIVTVFLFAMVSWVNPFEKKAPNSEKEIEAIIINDSAVNIFADYLIDAGLEVRDNPQELVENVKITLATLLKKNPELSAVDKQELETQMLLTARKIVDAKSPTFQTEVAASLCSWHGFCCPMQGQSRAICCSIYCNSKCDCR